MSTSPEELRELDAEIAVRLFGWTWEKWPLTRSFAAGAGKGEILTALVSPCSGMRPNDSQPSDAAEPRFRDWDRELPRYSEVPGAAQSVIDALTNSGWLVRVQWMPAGLPFETGPEEDLREVHKRCAAMLNYIKGRTSSDPAETRKYIRDHHNAFADTAPEAICRAALLALGGKA